MKYCADKGINYKCYVSPDKSVVLKDYLPWDVDKYNRIVDEFSDIVLDLLPIFRNVDFMVTDTHMSRLAAFKTGIYMIYKLHPEKSIDYYIDSIWDRVKLNWNGHRGDLIGKANWSYDYDDYFNKYFNYHLFEPSITSSFSVINDQLPPEFKTVGKRETFYFRNENSVSDKKCLFCTASSGVFGKIPLIAYYREVIYYWDHWYFNQDLVDWFNPDDIIELRAERFLANPLCPIVKEGSHVKIPVNMKMLDYSNDNNILTLVVDVKDYHMMPINTTCNIMVNDILSKEYELDGIRNTFEIDVSSLENKMYYLTIHINESEKTLDYEYKVPVSKIDSGLYIPVYNNIQKVTVNKGTLNLRLSFADYAMAAVDNICELFIDDNLVKKFDLNKKFGHSVSVDISNLSKGTHKLGVHLPQTIKYKESLKEKEFDI